MPITASSLDRTLDVNTLSGGLISIPITASSLERTLDVNTLSGGLNLNAHHCL